MSMYTLLRNNDKPSVHQMEDAFQGIYSVLVSLSRPKALYHSESDNLFHIILVVADWVG